MGLEGVQTDLIADYKAALTAAFKALEDNRNSESNSAQCNQAIMLISDGEFIKFIQFRME